MKKKEIIRSSGISSLEELKEKKLVTLSPYPPHRGSSQPPGTKRSRNGSEEEDEIETERHVRARSISRSCLPRKTIKAGYGLMMETPKTTDVKRRKEAELDIVSGSGP